MKGQASSGNYPSKPCEIVESTQNGHPSLQQSACPSYAQVTNTKTIYPPMPTPNANGLQQKPTDTPIVQYQYTSSSDIQPEITYMSGAGSGGAGSVGAGMPIPPQHIVGQQPVVIIHQNAKLALGPEQARVRCPTCHIEEWTRINHEPNSKTHLIAALLCLLGFWCCVCVPYCTDSCLSTHHYCGKCDTFLGTYNSGGF